MKGLTQKQAEMLMQPMVRADQLSGSDLITFRSLTKRRLLHIASQYGNSYEATPA